MRPRGGSASFDQRDLAFRIALRRLDPVEVQAGRDELAVVAAAIPQIRPADGPHLLTGQVDDGDFDTGRSQTVGHAKTDRAAGRGPKRIREREGVAGAGGTRNKNRLVGGGAHGGADIEPAEAEAVVETR